MKLPLSLLETFLKTDLSPEEIAERLTLLGIEVDHVDAATPPFSGVVVTKVETTTRHPHADKLQIAQVFDGTKTHTVVCSAPNCRAGLRTAFAKIGARLKAADGSMLAIERTKIRDVESEGMLCSSSELQMSSDSQEILEFPEDLPLGQEVGPLLWDPVFEISLTPNLGHCMSALGIARELGAALQKQVHLPRPSLSENSHTHLPQKMQVTISHPKLCPRYLCRLIEGVHIADSPFWLKKILEAAGQRSINNVVDCLNLILLQYGQPMHAFDYDKLEGQQLHVKSATESFSFLGLDEQERKVAPGTILICDAKKPVALAGILGGANSAVSTNTRTLLLEAACFDPIAIRIGAQKAGLRTESSQRFEKGIDRFAIESILDLACELILKVAGGQVAKGKIDLHTDQSEKKEIVCRLFRVNQLLGTKLSLTEIEHIFHRLQFKTKQLLEQEALSVSVPSYRNDVQQEVDLIEEVARIYGYNHIEKPAPRLTLSSVPHDPNFLFERLIRQRLIGLGLQEFLASDLISPKLAFSLNEPAFPPSSFLQTMHSKSEEHSVLRTSLLPGLLQITQKNLDFKNTSFAAFELGRIHFLQNKDVIEIPMAALLLTGKASLPHWKQKPLEVDFFDLKGLLENLLASFKVPEVSFVPSHHASFHPGRQADLCIQDVVIGSFGEIHPQLLETFSIKQRVLFAQINLQELRKHTHTHPRMVPLPQFPASERDWTISLPKLFPIETVLSTIKGAKSSLLEKIELIDLYHPPESDQKNATFRFTYRNLAKTLSFEEVETEHARILEFCRKTF